MPIQSNDLRKPLTSWSIFVAVLALALLSALPAALAQGVSTAVDEVRALNARILHDLLVERDASTLEANTLDDFLVIAPGGRVEDKQQALAGVGSLDVRSIELSDERWIERDDMIVLIGKLVADGTMQPLGKLPPMKYLAVFVRADGEWKMQARSLTMCAPIAVQRGVC